MQIVLRSPAGDQDVDVTLHNPDATLGDLVRSAGWPAGDTVVVGGRPMPAACPVSDSGLHEGASLLVSGSNGYEPHAEGHSRRGPGPRTDLQLVVVSGPSAGRAIPLSPGPASVGRSSGNTITLDHRSVSRRHCEFRVAPDGRCAVIDLGAANTTVVNGARIRPQQPVELGIDAVVEIGAYAVAVRPNRTDDRPRGANRHGHAGATPVNRPPRTAARPPSDQLAVPREPTDATRPDLNITTIVAPLVLAGAMIAITGSLTFALFALLSPILGIGLWVEGGRRVGKKNAAARAKHDDELRELRGQIRAANAHDAARLRARCPDPAEALRRAALPSVLLWERRPRDDDYLALFTGIGDIEWRPQLQLASGTLPDEIAARPEATHLRSAPVAAELGDGGVIGIVGDREAALALGRSLLCQAAVHHGPADLTIGIFADTGRAPAWDWAKWLPHTQEVGAGAGARWLGEGREQSDELLKQLVQGAGGPTVLAVIDSDTFTDGKDAPARELLRNDRHAHRTAAPPPARASGIIIASTADRLPSMCNTVVEVDRDAGATVRLPDQGREIEDVLTAGLPVDVARSCALDLARFEDPELNTPGGNLPDLVRLVPLLGLEAVDAESIRRKWRRGAGGAHLVAPLGVTEQGVFTLDLVDDGPHGLVGGTTGSGKSELLRTLVASLATGTDPRYLTFVLIDYKGGAAFDQCARLPHTVGLVTDLDAQLSERALVALNAELHHRERQLRAVGADNIVDYLRYGPPEPLPRLLVIVDEFATLAKELPEFMTSLVGIAQRGRSLGVHMILATQRPSGAVSEDIRANTNLKIALRVADAADSTDVINDRAAAEISRNNKGRAYARLGPKDLVPLQTALVTCAAERSSDVPVSVTPFAFGPVPQLPPAPVPDDPAGNHTDLVRLVDAIVEAAELDEIPPPRKPWPEPLPHRVPLTDLATTEPDTAGPVAMIALADDPRNQTQYPVGWDLSDGNLVLFGIPGSGTTTALAAIALALAAHHSPDEVEFQVFDFGVGDLAALEGLPHTGTVVLAGDRERQMRLARHLVAELDRRRRAGPAARARRLVVLVDNFAAMRAAFGDTEGQDLMDRLARVFADGQGVGISFVLTADRLTVVPGAFSAPQQWLFRMSDPYDYSSVGVDRRNLPAQVPGRAVIARSGLHVHVGLPTPSIPAAVGEVAARWPSARRVADVVGTLPSRVALADLTAAAAVSTEPWTVPIGVSEADLATATLQLYEGEHALIAGPARSGRTTALRTIAAVLRAAPDPVHIAGMGGRRSTLRDCGDLDRFASTPGEAAAMLAQLRTVPGAVALLIDDAETFDDADGAIATLLAAELPALHVVVAANNDSLRGLYGHWTKTIRRSRVGVLLKPNIDMDGELLGGSLPRRAPVSLTEPGRGYLVSNGEVQVVQVAQA